MQLQQVHEHARCSLGSVVRKGFGLPRLCRADVSEASLQDTVMNKHSRTFLRMIGRTFLKVLIQVWKPLTVQPLAEYLIYSIQLHRTTHLKMALRTTSIPENRLHFRVVVSASRRYSIPDGTCRYKSES